MTIDRETLRVAVRRALDSEHLSGCEQNDCEIRMAADLGYDFLAAERLLDATEAPSLAATLARASAWRAWAKAEFDLFAIWHDAHTVRCPGCGGYIRFDSARPMTICSSCHTPVARPTGRKMA